MSQGVLLPRDNDGSKWSVSHPGFVLPACGDGPEFGLAIHHLTGISLRVGGEVALCFDCGPDGGVYHPDAVDMDAVRRDAHRHPDTATARFESTKEEHRRYHMMGGGKATYKTAPAGPQLPYVELTEDEATFLVVVHYEFTGEDLVKDQVFKDHPTRAAWRRSMDLYVQAARCPGYDPVGGGAIPLATVRMMLSYRLEPVYVIQGWQPTGPRWLP